jgi:hypothetical protein
VLQQVADLEQQNKTFASNLDETKKKFEDLQKRSVIESCCGSWLQNNEKKDAIAASNARLFLFSYSFRVWLQRALPKITN